MKALQTVGTVIYIIAGVLLFVFYLISLQSWLGFLGLIIAIVVAPGLVVFPILFWIVEGVFPVMYFLIWGGGLLGLAIAGVASRDE